MTTGSVTSNFRCSMFPHNEESLSSKCWDTSSQNITNSFHNYRNGLVLQKWSIITTSTLSLPPIPKDCAEILSCGCSKGCQVGRVDTEKTAYHALRPANATHTATDVSVPHEKESYLRATSCFQHKI